MFFRFGGMAAMGFNPFRPFALRPILSSGLPFRTEHDNNYYVIARSALLLQIL